MGATPAFVLGLSGAFVPGSSLDFGLVEPETVLSATAATASPLASGVTASAVIVYPAARPEVISYQPFSVVSVGPPVEGTGTPVHLPGGAGGPHAPHGLIHGGGAQGPVGSGAGPPTVSGSAEVGQYLIVTIAFNAGPFADATFKANLIISSPDWDDAVTIPLSAQVASLSMGCAPTITVVEGATATLDVTVACAGTPMTATLTCPRETWPPTVTIAIDPPTLNLVPGTPQIAKVLITADPDLNTPSSQATLYIYGAGLSNIRSVCETSLTILGNVPPPGVGLASAHNYYLANAAGNCAPIINLEVSISVWDDMVSQDSFSFQLNALTPKNSNCVWQQYVFEINTSGPTTELGGRIEYWPAKNYNITKSGNIVDYGFGIVSLPSHKLPANYSLKIKLANDNKTGNVTSATFTVVDNNGKKTRVGPLVITNLNIDGAPGQVPSTALSPIAAFEINIVGIFGGKAQLTSGGGTITYSAQDALTVSSGRPKCVSNAKVLTYETGNTTYSEMPEGAGNSFQQSFGTS